MKDRPRTINGVKVPYEKEINELQDMLESEMPYFTVACIALGNKEDIKSLNILGNILLCKDWCKRRVAVEALEYHPLCYILTDKLIKLLEDKSEFVIRTTLNTIGEQCIKKAHSRVLYLISSSNEEIRQAAIESLENISYEEDYDFIIRTFLYDESKRVRDKAAWFIRIKSNCENWRRSFEMLKSSNLARHRVWACELVDIFGDENTLFMLKELENDKDGHVRKIAIRLKNKLWK